MNLIEAIAATGMTPPRRALVPGKWLRFPGIGKGHSNRSGWCRVITPTMAIFGDWSSGLKHVWVDEAHIDDERSRKALRDAQARERRFACEQRAKQNVVARKAQTMVWDAVPALHPYLARKGFPSNLGLTLDGKLLVPVMDFQNYPRVISAQLISENGEKKFLTGGRAKGGVYRFGVAPEKARRVVLCEGYATGLTLEAALRTISGSYCVIVCFSANNLEYVSSLIDRSIDALVCTDNDFPNKMTGEKAGQASAIRTGRRWIMPTVLGEDFNDLMLREGIRSVVNVLRIAFNG